MSRQQYASECIGTLLLVCTVVGSGIMADSLSAGNEGIALLGNTIATGAILVVLITLFGPLSGAHFNPVVTMVMACQKEMRPKAAALYIIAQITGGMIGTWLAHAMFDTSLFQLSVKDRSGLPQYGAEIVATFGLLLVILIARKVRQDAIALLVGLYITAAYWFTASTSFANPAVTIARTFTDSFSGIHYADTPYFIMAQIGGALLAMIVANWLLSADD
ncbi:MAG: aquaporin [Candidatus Puniceispirillaceae bacterium]